MKKPLKREPECTIDRQGTRWYKEERNYYTVTYCGYIGFDNFNGTYIRYNRPTKLTGVWDQ